MDLLHLTSELQRHVRSIDAARLSPPEVAALLDQYALLEKLAAAGKTALAATLRGHAGARAVAAATGSSFGQAKDVIETGKRLRDQPLVAAAMAAGLLSQQQASEVSAGVEKDPDAAAHLLEVAASSTLRDLRDEVRRIIAGADPDPDASYDAVKASRYVRYRSSRDGAVEGSFRLTADSGALIFTALEAEADRLYRTAARAGMPLIHDQALADALVTLITGKGSSSRVGVKMIVKVDITAPGGPGAEIRGAGPIPMSRARDLLANAFVAGIVEDGADIMKVKHLAHRPSALQKTALEWLFDGCADAGCDRRLGIEIDHVEPWSNDGETTIRNLDPKCRPDHAEKTKRDWAQGRIRGRPTQNRAPGVVRRQRK